MGMEEDKTITQEKTISHHGKDPINPDYYKSGGIETIDMIEAKMSKEEFKGYLLGSVMKYLSRKKSNWIEDLKKARWYLNRLVIEEEKSELSNMQRKK